MIGISRPREADRRHEQQDASHATPTSTREAKAPHPEEIAPRGAELDLAHVVSNMKTKAQDEAQSVASAGMRPKLSSHAAASRTYGSVGDAQTAFAAQSKKLLDVAHWSELSGPENAKFSLYDATGTKIASRPASVGDFVRIDLPGQTQSDWVRVEDVGISPDRVGVRVRPSYDPTKRPLTPDVTAHFFTREATNTFLVERDGAKVAARVEGRDERANVGFSAGGGVSALRNRAVAEGAWGLQRDVPVTGLRLNGMQQHQWNVFTQNLVHQS